VGYQGTIPGSAPQLLRSIPQRCQTLVGEAANTICDEATDYMLETVKVNTPVSHNPGVPGYEWVAGGGDGIHLREEIRRTEVQQHAGVYEAKVGSDKSYVLYVEYGTGLYGPKHAKYLIEPTSPGGLLRFPMHGKMVSARYVWHPGSPGQHMFLYGGRMTELSMRQLAVRGLEQLRLGME